MISQGIFTPARPSRAARRDRSLKAAGCFEEQISGGWVIGSVPESSGLLFYCSMRMAVLPAGADILLLQESSQKAA